MSTKHPSLRGRGVWLYFVMGVTISVFAGLLWLQQSASLAAAGRRIFALETRRQELVERRSALLLRYTAATDPHRLETRAREMGFGPSDSVLRLPVASRGIPEGQSGLAVMSGPIGLYHAGHKIGEPAQADGRDRPLPSLPLTSGSSGFGTPGEGSAP